VRSELVLGVDEATIEDRFMFIFCSEEFGHGNAVWNADGKLFFEWLTVFFEF